MLIEFRVENHRSLRDEQALTMEAVSLGDGDDSRVRVTEKGLKLLPAVALYGSNASGKSNVLDALSFMRKAVMVSQRVWGPDEGVPRNPFAWGPARQEPSTFIATFLQEEVKYEYGFSVSDQVVEEEWLFAWPQGRKQTWFEREGDQFKFGENLKGPNSVVEEITRSNALFLSAAVQNNHQQLKPVYRWFLKMVMPNQPVPNRWRFNFRDDDRQRSLFSQDTSDAVEAHITQLFLDADVGIVGIKSEVTEKKIRNRMRQRHKFFFQHQEDNNDSWLPLSEESQGTQSLFRLAPTLLRTLDTGGLLLVDELKANLHPAIGQKIMELFASPKTNPKNAQIIFTTHDTNLIGTTLGEPVLRRDQVWFTEKDNEGATKLYPLTDYKPRKSNNLERGYLQGRFGAVPFLGDMVGSEE